MPDQLFKLQPHRTMYLKGFDRRGAAAAMTQASASGFTLSGVWSDQADFAVLMLYDADDNFGHLTSSKYLPDFNLSGVKLDFDMSMVGCQDPTSKKYQSIPWGMLSYIKQDGTRGTAALNITSPTGRTGASTTLTIPSGPFAYGAELILWYQNLAFDFFCNGGETGATVAAGLAQQINAVDWNANGPVALTASASGSDLIITAEPGADGNFVTFYQSYSTPAISPRPGYDFQLSGGSSDNVNWHVQIDFTALGLANIRQAWLTFAPALANGVYVATEWSIRFTNWTVTDSNNVTPLKIAGPGSVVAPSRDAWTKYAGTGWTERAGFFYHGFAKASGNANDSITIQYSCQYAHDLYLGTYLAYDGGTFHVALDGVSQQDCSTALEGALSNDSPLAGRRALASNIAAGLHTVVLTVASGTCYFDYLQAAVRSDVPDPAVTYSKVNAALDFDTDQTYKIPPARALWILEKAGFTGDIDFYAGVFFALKRVRNGGHFYQAVVSCDYTIDNFVTIGGTTIGCTVLPAYPWQTVRDTADDVAARLALQINQKLVGVWARADGSGNLIITSRSPFYNFTEITASGGASVVSQDATAGNEGVWQVDSSQSLPLNRAFKDYLTDFATLVYAAGQTMTVAFSQEVLGPPDSDDAASASVTFAFFNSFGAGYTHYITIGSRTYSYVQQPSDGSGDLATKLAALINAGAGDPNAVATADANNVYLTMRVGGSVACSASDWNGPGTLKSGAWSQRFHDGTQVLTATGFGSWGAGFVEAVDSGVYQQTGHGYITGNVAHFANAASAGSWILVVVDADHYTLGAQIVDANHPHTAGYTPGVGDAVFIDVQTTQCNFSPTTFTPYLTACYKQAAGILAGVGLPPWLQFGEMGWWFFGRINGMRIGWASYTAPISIGTVDSQGAPLPHTLNTGEWVIVAGVKENTAANTRAQVTKVDDTHFSLNGTSGNGDYVASTGTVCGGGMAYYDAHTKSGRSLGDWYTQDDDPSVDGYGDANYLRGLVYAHMHSIAQAVKSAYPSAKFEWLLPMDVNSPTVYWNDGYPYPQGGRLNNYVNIPAEYMAPNSDVDRVKIEALSWGLSYYNVDLTKAAIAYASTVLSYPKAATAFLAPWSNGSCAWKQHYLAAVNAQIPLIAFWALDHMCLLSWPVTKPADSAYSQFL